MGRKGVSGRLDERLLGLLLSRCLSCGRLDVLENGCGVLRGSFLTLS